MGKNAVFSLMGLAPNEAPPTHEEMELVRQVRTSRGACGNDNPPLNEWTFNLNRQLQQDEREEVLARKLMEIKRKSQNSNRSSLASLSSNQPSASNLNTNSQRQYASNLQVNVTDETHNPQPTPKVLRQATGGSTNNSPLKKKH